MINPAGFQYGGEKVWFIGRVGKVLGLETESRSIVIGLPFFTGIRKLPP